VFARHAVPAPIRWEPQPDDQAAHDWLLTEFTADGHVFGPYPFTTNVKGNIGEAVSLCIGRQGDFAGWRVDPANAHDPFSALSRPGVDLVWINDGAEGLQVALQEVKTSGAPNVAVAADLLEDYRKLFGDDARVALASRLQAIAYRIQLLSEDFDLADRLRAVAGNAPATCTGIKLVPTAIHSAYFDAARNRVLGVRTALVGDGWTAVEPWCVSLGDLDARLERLMQGQA
jgi:hypothetical protein